MNQEQRRLMQVLADYLDNFVEQDLCDPEFDPNRLEFDMGSFFSTLVTADGHHCKTTACAIGHAARLPEFNAAGLFAGKPGSDDESDFILNGELIDGFTAAMRVFGIDYEAALHLFGIWTDRSAKEEAGILREFLDSRKDVTINFLEKDDSQCDTESN